MPTRPSSVNEPSKFCAIQQDDILEEALAAAFRAEVNSLDGSILNYWPR